MGFSFLPSNTVAQMWPLVPPGLFWGLVFHPKGPTLSHGKKDGDSQEQRARALFLALGGSWFLSG